MWKLSRRNFGLNINMFTRSARQFSCKVKDSTSVELSDSPEEVFVYNELHFEQKEQVVKFKRQNLKYISGNFLETASETQFPLAKPVNYHDALQKIFSNQENINYTLH